MKCIDCKHLQDKGTYWQCGDIEISDPFMDFHCDNFEPIKKGE
jgi:hypothetical protein